MKKRCASCDGSGQIQYFKGVSRFLLSTDECPACGGLGYTFTDIEEGGCLETEDDNQCEQPEKKQEK